MTPVLAFVNRTYCSRGNAVFLGEGDACFPIGTALPNLFHLFFGKASRMMRFAYGQILPTLILHVLHVVRVCSKKEMVGIRARRIVAFVENVQPLWNRVVGKFPCEAVGADASLVYAEKPVAPTVMTTSPQPTLIRSALVYLSPKAFQKWAVVTVSAAPRVMVVDKAQRLSFDGSFALIRTFCKIGLLSATTFAVAVSSFNHSKTSCRYQLARLSRTYNRRQEAWKTIAFSLLTDKRRYVLDTSIIAHLNEYSNHVRIGGTGQKANEETYRGR